MPTAEVSSDHGAALVVVSAGARRIRVRANWFRFDAVRAVAIEDSVATVAGVDAVRAYPRTASVVVWYSPERCDTAAILSAIAAAEHIPAESVPARAPHSVEGGNPGVVQRILDWSERTLSGEQADRVSQRPVQRSD
ncbi:hypothetical protein [Mycobacterium avium]